MRRPLSIVAAVVAALTIPFASAVADELPAPGTYSTFSSIVDTCSGGVCTFAEVRVELNGGTASAVCLYLSVYDEVTLDPIELGDGCTQSGIGTVTIVNKFVVGVAATSVTLTRPDTTTFTRTVSASDAITSSVVRDRFVYQVSDPCPGTWTGSYQTVDVAGTATIGGVTYNQLGMSQNLQAKLRQRC